jgi:non-ribosomal peptide synthetase component F
MTLPPEQEAIRAKCFHPAGTFVEFPEGEIELSIPERFEKIVGTFPDRLALKSKNRALTYRQLNEAANRVAGAILAVRGKKPEAVALMFEQGAAARIAI